MKSVEAQIAIQDCYLDQPYALAGRIIDPVPGKVSWQGKHHHLRRKELEVLALLASVGGAVVSRANFIAAVWGGNDMIGDRGISDTIFSLRRNLQDEDALIPLIRTIPRRGYQLSVAVVQPITTEQTAFLPYAVITSSPDWRLQRRLSESDTSESWLAVSSATDSPPRVFRFCRSEAQLRRLRRETTLLRYISESLGERHDLALIRDWQLQEPPYFIACDYCTLGKLSEWADSLGGLSTQTLAQREKLMADLTAALASVHAIGIVHGNVCADSILLSDSETGPQLKLSAFDLGALSDHKKLAALKITSAGLSFADSAEAPKIADDLYGLGLLLLQLSTGDMAAQADETWLTRIPNPDWRNLISACFGPAAQRPSAAQLHQQLTGSANAAPEQANAIPAVQGAPIQTPPVPAATLHASGDLAQTVGSYHVLDRLGEGGMGTVYLAEQREPYRKVALKVIRAGLDGKQVLARFDAERQALALMNHPNVATVLESGLAADGRPFFAMEYIVGTDIGEYCDTHHLSLQARVKLFLQVCDGVLHAHQKGVLHRDIKPSNLMVSAAHDQAGVVKVIDFGLAKSLQGKLVAQTLHTSFGAFMGTPIYSSPEHVSGSATGVDTRSDIYSMGVVLYELLAGLTPIASESLENLEPEKVRELICKSVLPSMRNQLSSAPAQRRSEIASNRAISAEALPQTLDGDLSWVVGKCLERDPNDRYASVLELKKDLQRWLELRPVEARPTTRWYRFRKLVRRNRSTAILIAASVTALLLTTTAAVTGYLRAERALKQAQIATDNATEASEFQVKQIQSLDPHSMGEGLQKSLAQAVEKSLAQRDAAALAQGQHQLETLTSGVNFTDLITKQLDEYYFQPSLKLIGKEYGKNPLLQAALWQSAADTLVEIGFYERAIEPQEKALAIRRQALGENHVLTLVSSAAYGELLFWLGKIPSAKVQLQDAVLRMRRTIGVDSLIGIKAISELCEVYDSLGELIQTRACLEESLTLSRQVSGDLAQLTLARESRLGSQLLYENNIAKAQPLIEHSHRELLRLLGANHIDTLTSLTVLGALRRQQGRKDEALTIAIQAADLYEQKLGRAHETTLSLKNNVAMLLSQAGRNEEALVRLREVDMRRESAQGKSDVTVQAGKTNIGNVLVRLGRLSEAEHYLPPSMAEVIRLTDPASGFALNAKYHTGNLRRAQGRFAEAEKLYQDIMDVRLTMQVPEEPLLALVRDQQGLNLLAQGKIDSARAMLKAALEDSRKVASNQTALTIKVQSHYAQTLPAIGPAPNAISMLTETIAQMRGMQGVELEVQISAPTALAKLLNDKNRAQEALVYAQQAVDIGKTAFPKGHYLLAAALIQQGRALIALGGAEAKTVLVEAKKQIDSTEGLDPSYGANLREVLDTLKGR